jgi:hypothetical protein
LNTPVNSNFWVLPPSMATSTLTGQLMVLFSVDAILNIVFPFAWNKYARASRRAHAKGDGGRPVLGAGWMPGIT